MYAKDLKIAAARQEAYLLTQLVTKTITIKGFFSERSFNIFKTSY